MRIAYLSDVHANLPAFEAALDRAKRWGADEVHLLGDLVGKGPHPKEVVALARKRGLDTVQGNHDRLATGQEPIPAAVRKRFPQEALELDAHAEWAARQLDRASLAWLASRTGQRRLRLGRFHVLETHASVGSVWDGVGPRADEATLARHLDASRADVLLVGHTHVAEARRLADGRWFLNPGSVGASRDGPEASLLLADFSAERFEIARVAYDVEGFHRDRVKAEAEYLPVPSSATHKSGGV